MKYFVIGDQDTVLGFSLAGVEGRSVKTKEQTKKAFDDTIADTSIGIIIITEKIASFIKSDIDAYLFKRDFPLIVEIPDREGPSVDRLKLRDTVNAAIGIKL